MLIVPSFSSRGAVSPPLPVNVLEKYQDCTHPVISRFIMELKLLKSFNKRYSLNLFSFVFLQTQLHFTSAWVVTIDY